MRRMSRACLRAAAHRVGHFVTRNAMTLAELLKLLEVKLLGHFPQRVVSRLRVTEPTQDLNQPLPCIRHLNPTPRDQCCSSATRTSRAGLALASRMPNHSGPTPQFSRFGQQTTRLRRRPKRPLCCPAPVRPSTRSRKTRQPTNSSAWTNDTRLLRSISLACSRSWDSGRLKPSVWSDPRHA